MFLRLVGDELHVDPFYETLPDDLKREIDQYMENLSANDWGRPCIWRDETSKLCRNYEHRPEMCREFELGGADCLRIRDRAMTMREFADGGAE